MIAIIIIVALIACAAAGAFGWHRGYMRGWTDCGDRVLNNPPWSREQPWAGVVERHSIEGMDG